MLTSEKLLKNSFLENSKSYQGQYGRILRKLINEPHKVGNSRIGNINSRFCEQIRINLKKEFPLQEIKKIKFSNIIHELLWMIKGNTNVKYLIKNNCGIWTDDALRFYKEMFDDENITKDEFIENVLNESGIIGYDINNRSYKYGDLFRIYGFNWRNFNGKTDQLQNCINTLLNNPDDRRMIVTAHNPTDIEEKNVGLPSCHNMFQFYTTINKDGSRNLSCFVNIRSNDWFLGQPYNAAQYALLIHIIANIVNMKVDELVINAVDAHLYHAHFDAANEWLERYNKIVNKIFDNFNVGEKFEDTTYSLAKLKINKNLTNIDDLNFEDFNIKNYNSQSMIKAKLLT